MVAAAHHTWKLALKHRSDAMGDIDEAIKLLNKKMGAWDDEQDRLEREAQAEANRKAVEAFEAEKLKRAEEAQKALDEGKEETAAAILDTAPVAPVVEHVPREKPKVVGLTIKREWKARIVDASKVPHEFRKCEPDQTLLNAFARSSEGSKEIPGVVFYQDRIPTSPKKSK
jgi:hypothetical protein